MLIIPIKEGENIDRALKRFKRKFDKTGLVATANEGPHLNTSSFFVTLRPSGQEIREFKNKHTIFGQVVEGLDGEVHLLDVSVAARLQPRLQAGKPHVGLGKVRLRRKDQGDRKVGHDASVRAGAVRERWREGCPRRG